jgi:alkyldihydroxyacetonephosphate synthase
MARRRRSHWAWGYADEEPTSGQAAETAELMAGVTGFELAGDLEDPIPPAAVPLPEPRLAPPAAAAEFCTSEPYDRLTHTYGQAYRDLIRAFRGSFQSPPDVVAYPRDERDIERVLEWAEHAGAAVVPFGGGTSVVGGVEPRDLGPAISLDLSRLGRVLEVDPVSRAARIQAGAAGPALNEQLGERGFTLAAGRAIASRAVSTTPRRINPRGGTLWPRWS